jgi:hypothetical protein
MTRGGDRHGQEHQIDPNVPHFLLSNRVNTIFLLMIWINVIYKESLQSRPTSTTAARSAFHNHSARIPLLRTGMNGQFLGGRGRCSPNTDLAFLFEAFPTSIETKGFLYLAVTGRERFGSQSVDVVYIFRKMETKNTRRRKA